MYKINCLSILTVFVVSNLNSGNQAPKDHPEGNLKKKNDKSGNKNVNTDDKTGGSSNVQQNNNNTKSTNNTSKVDPDEHNIALGLIMSKLESVGDQLTKNGVDLVKKYDLVNMIAGKRVYNIKHRADFDICSNFGWDDATRAWKTRFSTYNYHICRLDQGGGGDCFFHSLAGSLRMAGFTVGKLKKMNAGNRNFERFTPKTLSEDAYFTHIQLRKMASAFFITYNPELEGDLNNFDKETFLDRMTFYNMPDAYTRYASEDRIKADLAKSLEDTPVVEVANKVYDLHSRVSGEHWGDAFDKFALESILDISILLFRTQDSCVLLGDYDASKTPKAYVLIYYYDMNHYQSAGIVNVEDPDNVHSAYITNELPDVLSLITFLDTGIEVKK